MRGEAKRFSASAHNLYSKIGSPVIELAFCRAAVQPEAVPADNAPKKGSVQKWENGFQIERLHMGKLDGKLAKPGKKVMVKYRGTLSNGKVFDETKGSRTFGFRLGRLGSAIADSTLVSTSCSISTW